MSSDMNAKVMIQERRESEVRGSYIFSSSFCTGIGSFRVVFA